MLDSILKTDRREFEAEVRESAIPVVVEFRADWCDHCQELEPVLDELADTYEGTIRTMTVDIDDESRLANDYHIAAIPTFIGFHHGNMLKRISGELGAEALEELFEYLANLPHVSS